MQVLCREPAPCLLLPEQVPSETVLLRGLLTLLPPSLGMSFRLPNDGWGSQVSGRNVSKSLPAPGTVQRGGVAVSKPCVSTKAGVSQSTNLQRQRLPGVSQAFCPNCSLFKAPVQSPLASLPKGAGTAQHKE